MTHPETMAGGGQYNDHSTAQSSAAALAMPILRQAAASAPMRPDGSLAIADYGCSEGRNSLAPMSTAIDEIRRVHPPGLPISVVHTDLPQNDFSSLFATVARDPLTYAGSQIYTSAVGESFYRQILPPGSVSLGWSSIALHWLSAAPNHLEGIWFTDGAPSEREGWARQASDDWAQFLDARGQELLPEAKMIIVVGSADTSGNSGAEGVMAALARVADEMVQSGRISRTSLTAIPAWYRTAAQWQEPFPHASLTLDHFDEVILGDPIAAQNHSGDRAQYAHDVAEAIRVSFGPSLLTAVSSADRADVERALFSEGLAAAIRDDITLGFNWRLAIMMLTRRSPKGAVGPDFEA